MSTCKECNTVHDGEIVKPDLTTLVDYQCAACGTLLTAEQVSEIVNNLPEEFKAELMLDDNTDEQSVAV